MKFSLISRTAISHSCLSWWKRWTAQSCGKFLGKEMDCPREVPIVNVCLRFTPLVIATLFLLLLQASQPSGLWPLSLGSAGWLSASPLEISSLMPNWPCLALYSPGYGLVPGQHHPSLAGVGKCERTGNSN